MKEYIEERAVNIANYIIETKATVRQTANAGKVERAIREAAGRCADKVECEEMNPA